MPEQHSPRHKDGPQGRGRIAWWIVTAIVLSGAAWSFSYVGRALIAMPSMPDRWILQVAVFCGTAVLPQLYIELIAWTAERLTPDLPPNLSTRWFRNLGAFVGLVERPLLLGALVARFPPFVAVWFVFKGIAGYRIGLQRKQLEERRLFQLFLLNNALSLAGVGLGWLVWKLLRLPV